MGNNPSTLRPEVMADLKNTTAFDHNEIGDLYRQFRHDCGPDGGLTMTLEDFKNMYRDVFPGGNPDKFAEHVFRTYDKEKRGEINFREFMTSLSVQLKGNLQDKLEWAFNLYDTSGNGYITREDTKELITSMSKLNAGTLPGEKKVTAEQLTEHIFEKADKNKNDRITKQEFVTAAVNSKTIQFMLQGASAAASSPFTQRKQRSGSFGRPRASSFKSTKDSPDGSPRTSRTNTLTEVNIP